MATHPMSQMRSRLHLALAFTLGTAPSAFAQQPCALGSRVELKGGSTGTLAEVGTEVPHVGWYRIVFTWSPRGEWYDPRSWETYAAGTTQRCLPPSAAAPRTEPKAAPPAPQPGRRNDAQPLPRETADCPLAAPPGSVSKDAKASPQLFKRVIYERAAAVINPASISAPKQIGLTFLEFQLGEAYENTLTSTRFGDKRLHTGAPAGEMIYPLKTKELQCDLHGREVRRTVSEISYSCFKGRSGEWTCPGRTTKTLESRLLPLPER